MGDIAACVGVGDPCSSISPWTITIAQCSDRSTTTTEISCRCVEATCTTITFGGRWRRVCYRSDFPSLNKHLWRFRSRTRTRTYASNKAHAGAGDLCVDMCAAAVAWKPGAARHALLTLFGIELIFRKNGNEIIFTATDNFVMGACMRACVSARVWAEIYGQVCWGAGCGGAHVMSVLMCVCVCVRWSDRKVW